MKILFVANPDADGTEETQRMIKSLYNDVEILMAFSKERADHYAKEISDR